MVAQASVARRLQLTPGVRQRMSHMTRRLAQGAGLALGVAFAALGTAVAKVAPASLDQLVAMSELILVGHVSQVTGDDTDPVAVVVVEERWYGAPPDLLQLSIGPTWSCDVSRAKGGERVVLFLDRDEAGVWRISHSGHGRMPVVDEHATVSTMVMLPGETGIRAEARAIAVGELRRMVAPRRKKVRQ